jgi:putative addiction module killer protein
VVEVVKSDTFDLWLRKLKDRRAAVRIVDRVVQLSKGNAGDVRPVGGGISELRIHHGPGYRVYYLQRGSRLILLLCGGDKSSQQRDIEAAEKIAAAWTWSDDDE